MRMLGGRLGQRICVWVWVIMLRASEVSVERLKSTTTSSESGVVIREPWSRASRLRMPASGNLARISFAHTAKLNPDAPAPWWQMNSGPFFGSVGGVR